MNDLIRDDINKQYAILKAIEVLNEAADVVYQHDYYGLPSTLTEEQQKPIDGEGRCVYNTDPYYEELYDTLARIAGKLERMLLKGEIK